MLLRRDFVFEKATRNTYRFAEVVPPGPDQNMAVGVLYVQKSAFGKQPERLTVTIQETPAVEQAARPSGS